MKGERKMMTLREIEATPENIEQICLFGLSPIRKILQSVDDVMDADGDVKGDDDRLYWLLSACIELTFNLEKKLMEFDPSPGLMVKLDKIIQRGQEDGATDEEKERSWKLREALVNILNAHETVEAASQKAAA
jgi:hypothetical protein